ncbi:hypothetical protein EOM39_04580, partial [Candidatus Gracilibacteria bacterium]|nr:hypothetical protein [Candidatus Gracilibacteria bacterium]
MKKTNSYFNFLVKFFTPAIKRKDITVKAMFPVIFNSVTSIISVYLIKEITNKIQDGFNEIYSLLVFLTISILLNYIVLLWTRRWTHAVIWPGLRQYMYSTYIPKYLYIDNNYIEKQGTGKLIAMIEKGMHAWVDLFSRFIEGVLPGIIMMIFSFVFISFINIYYALVLILLFLFTFYLTIFLQAKAKLLRRERRDLNIALTRRFVKVLMTKFEILQNDKGLEEARDIS